MQWQGELERSTAAHRRECALMSSAVYEVRAHASECHDLNHDVSCFAAQLGMEISERRLVESLEHNKAGSAETPKSPATYLQQQAELNWPWP